MSIITKRSERKTIVSFERSFTWRNDRSAGFFFPCSEAGELFPLNPAARKNYDFCVANPEQVIDNGVERSEHRYTESAEGRCSCGRLVVLDFDEAECVCGAIYNLSGQLLAPRRYWGEETGERFDASYLERD